MLVVVLAVVVLLSFGWSYRYYSRDISAAYRSRKRFGSRIIHTRLGPVEYATTGKGPVILVVHGAGGGYDQGIITGRNSIGEGYHIIAPSRFGYPGTPLPKDASAESQADVHAALLEALGIEKVIVLGISAGAPSAMQLAIRHPDKVDALILIVPLAYCPAPEQSRSAPFSFILAGVLKSNYPLWAALKLRKRVLLRMIGIPDAIQNKMSVHEKKETLSWLFPFADRMPGTMNDGKIASDLIPYPLHDIIAPTIIFSTKDDLWKTYKPAQYTALRISGAKFIGFEEGGHMLYAKEDVVRAEIKSFLSQSTPVMKERADLPHLEEFRFRTTPRI